MIKIIGICIFFIVCAVGCIAFLNLTTQSTLKVPEKINCNCTEEIMKNRINEIIEYLEIKFPNDQRH